MVVRGRASGKGREELSEGNEQFISLTFIGIHSRLSNHIQVQT